MLRVLLNLYAFWKQVFQLIIDKIIDLSIQYS